MGEGIWEKTSAMSQLKNDLEGFRIMWDHLGSFGSSWLHLGFIWKHLGSHRAICDHLGSYVSISAQVGSPGIILVHVVSSPG